MSVCVRFWSAWQGRFRHCGLFLRCTDSDRLNFIPLSFCVPVSAVELRALKYVTFRCPVAIWPAGVNEMPPKRKSKLHPVTRFAPAPIYKCADSQSIRLCSFLKRLAKPFLKKKKGRLFRFFVTMRKQ